MTADGKSSYSFARSQSENPADCRQRNSFAPSALGPALNPEKYRSSHRHHFVPTLVNHTGGIKNGESKAFDQNEGNNEAREHGDNASKAAGPSVAIERNRFVDTNKSGIAEGVERRARRGKADGLVAQFFFNWIHPKFHSERAPEDPVRTFKFYNFPSQYVAHRPEVFSSPAPLVSPSMEEILSKIICSLARVDFISVWEISDRKLVLFKVRETGSTLAVDLNSLTADAIRKKRADSNKKFGIPEDRS